MKRRRIFALALAIALLALALTGCGSKDNGSAADGDTVTVKATSRHSGGRTAVNQVELFDGQGRLLLTSSFTMYYMDGKK